MPFEITPIEEVSPDSMTDSELKEAFEVKFGKKPHWKMNPETIRAKLK